MEKGRISLEQRAKILDLKALGQKIISIPVHYEDDYGRARPNASLTLASFPAGFQGPLADLQPLVERYLALGLDLERFDWEPACRRQLGTLLNELEREYKSLQWSSRSGREDLQEGARRLYDLLRGINAYVDRLANRGETRLGMTQQAIDRLNGFSKADNDPISEVGMARGSDTIRRIHENAGRYQRSKITMKDLETHAYKAVEKLVSRVTEEAIGGRENAVPWSTLVAYIGQLQRVTSAFLSNFSTGQLYLTPSERQGMETNAGHVSSLSCVLLEAVFRVRRLDANFLAVMERTSVLLVNSVYLLRLSVEGELFLWNPIPKYVCNQRAMGDLKEAARLMDIFTTDQVQTLTEIATTCLSPSDKLSRRFDELLDRCRTFASVDQSRDDQWCDVVGSMFSFVHDCVESVEFLTGNYLVGRVGLFNDGSKVETTTKALVGELESAMDAVGMSERNGKDAEETQEWTSDKTTCDVTGKWLERLASMKSLLLAVSSRYSRLLASSSARFPGLPPSAERLSVYSFDADLLLVLMLFCKAQVNKTDKFRNRRAFDLDVEFRKHPGHISSGVPFASRPTRDSDGAYDAGDDDSDTSELVDIVGRMIRECDEQQSKDDGPSPADWADGLNEKRKRMEEMVGFLSERSSDRRAGESLKFSQELVSSIVFQIEACSKFNTTGGQSQSVKEGNTALISNLTRAVKGLLEDLKDVVKEGFQISSNISKEEERWIGEMLRWKNSGFRI